MDFGFWIEWNRRSIWRDERTRRKPDPLGGCSVLRIEILLSPDQPLQDAPNGKVVDVGAAAAIESVNFLKMEGDWAYVEELDPLPGAQRVRGWVRWRRGREILIRHFLNRLSSEVKKPS